MWGKAYTGVAFFQRAPQALVRRPPAQDAGGQLPRTEGARDAFFQHLRGVTVACVNLQVYRPPASLSNGSGAHGSRRRTLRSWRTQQRDAPLGRGSQYHWWRGTYQTYRSTIGRKLQSYRARPSLPGLAGRRQARGSTKTAENVITGNVEIVVARVLVMLLPAAGAELTPEESNDSKRTRGEGALSASGNDSSDA